MQRHAMTNDALPRGIASAVRRRDRRGRGRSLAQSTCSMRFASVPSPQPLSRRERGFYLLLPPGEGAPQGRMRVRAQPRAAETPHALRALPSPQPLSRRERGLYLLLPPGVGAPKGRMRVRCAASCSGNTACAARPDPHPNPSPGGRGAKPFTAGVFCASRHEPCSSGAPRYRGPHTSASRSRAGAGARFTRPPCTATPSARRR